MAARVPRFVIPRMSLAKPEAELDKAKQIADIYAKLDSMNKIRLRPAAARHVIFVGKTRAGKSTTVSQLQDPGFLVRPGSIFSDTKDPSIEHFTVEVPVEYAHEEDVKRLAAGNPSIMYNLSIIDTPGLFELKAIHDQEEARKIEILEEMIVDCMKQNICSIHAIFFVLAWHSSLDKQDVTALAEFLRLFGASCAQKHLRILITHCERMTEAERNDIEDQFRTCKEFQEVLGGYSPPEGEKWPKVIFFGAGTQTMADAGFTDVLEFELENSSNHRFEIFTEIFNCRESFPLDDVGAAIAVRDRTTLLYEKLKEKELSTISAIEISKLAQGLAVLSSPTKELAEAFVFAYNLLKQPNPTEIDIATLIGYFRADGFLPPSLRQAVEPFLAAHPIETQ